MDSIQKLSGFSLFDIEHWGLGLFRSICDQDLGNKGVFMETAFRSSGILPTRFGFLQRHGLVNPFIRWKEPELLSHFISGNVVGYTAILSKIGLPIKRLGAAQLLKLPSSASFFPLVYLDRLASIDPELRKTMACGYWKGGDEAIERHIIEESDVLNILGSNQSINDLSIRSKKLHPGIRVLSHGHKIGLAYVSKEFLTDPERLDQTLNGLVTDISAFDGGACYTVKNIYVQGDPRQFAEMLFAKLEDFEQQVSPVNENALQIGHQLYQVYEGSSQMLTNNKKRVFVRVKDKAEFWKPDELYRYVQVMRVENEKHVYELIRKESNLLQTAILAVPEEKILPVFQLFGKAGLSNIHYPGSAPLLNVYEEPHDGEFDAIRVRCNYSVRFSATNFQSNRDWLK